MSFTFGNKNLTSGSFNNKGLNSIWYGDKLLWTSVVYPTKGQLITMDLGNTTPIAGFNNIYRVLSINGSIAEVVAMYDMPNIEFNSSDVNTYNGGELDIS